MDFSYWDLKDKFTLVEAALLWTEQSPNYIFGSLRIKGEAARVFDALTEAVEKRELTLNFGNAVTREELTLWARGKYVQNELPIPKFLFYEQREGFEEEESTSEDATDIAQQSYDRTAEDARKRNEFVGVVKAMLVICPEYCKNDEGEITSDGVYEAIKKISEELWGLKKPLLKERTAKSIIDKLLKSFQRR